jgi:hypothetical protein
MLRFVAVPMNNIFLIYEKKTPNLNLYHITHRKLVHLRFKIFNLRQCEYHCILLGRAPEAGCLTQAYALHPRQADTPYTSNHGNLHRVVDLEQQQTEKIETEVRDVDGIRNRKVYASCPGWPSGGL